MPEIEINGRKIGPNYPPVVIAEIGINHGGVLDDAIKIAETAINSGAEIIKHQTHIIEDEMSDEAKFEIPDHTNISIFDIMKKCALSEEDEYKLMQHVISKGIIFISTPFSRAAANRLNKFQVPAFKIGSGECNNYPLIKHIANFKKPVILSTGMNSIDSIKPSVEILRKNKIPFALLHCTNVYPTPPELVRLDAISLLHKHFPDAVVGLSDHTTSNYTCLGAVALGASILERHYTDDMNREGPDISCSMDPTHLKDLIIGSKIIFSAKGNHKGAVSEESSIKSFAFASVVAIEDIKAGSLINEKNIWVRRPGNGDFKATEYQKLIGKIAKTDIEKNSQIKFHNIE